MENESTRKPVTKEKLVDDLKVVVRDAEDMIKSTAGEIGEKAREARAKLTVAVENAKETCRNLEEKAIEKARAADQVIRQHPYESLGIAFAVGVVIGFILKKR